MKKIDNQTMSSWHDEVEVKLTIAEMELKLCCLMSTALACECELIFSMVGIQTLDGVKIGPNGDNNFKKSGMCQSAAVSVLNVMKVVEDSDFHAKFDDVK